MDQERKNQHRALLSQEADTVNPIASTTYGKILVAMSLLMETVEQLVKRLPEPELITKVEIPNMARDVLDFHTKFGIQYDGPPRKLEGDLAKFRGKRSQEEAKEYVEALEIGDLESQLDANIDAIYIALGNLHLQGFKPEVIHEAWKRVHEKNLLKARTTKENPGKFGKLGADVDIVKPEGWTPPDLSDLCVASK